MASAATPRLQQRLVALQAGGGSLAYALDAALDACRIAPHAPLRHRLHALPPLQVQRVLAVAADAGAHPCAPGLLLARLLEGSLCHAADLLAATDPAEVASAVASLHAAAASGTLPRVAVAVAEAAFATLIKALVTTDAQQQDQGQQRDAEHALLHLRSQWVASGGSGAALLAAAVDVVDGQVFPRDAAARHGSVERLDCCVHACLHTRPGLCCIHPTPTSHPPLHTHWPPSAPAAGWRLSWATCCAGTATAGRSRAQRLAPSGRMPWRHSLQPCLQPRCWR